MIPKYWIFFFFSLAVNVLLTSVKLRPFGASALSRRRVGFGVLLGAQSSGRAGRSSPQPARVRGSCSLQVPRFALAPVRMYAPSLPGPRIEKALPCPGPTSYGIRAVTAAQKPKKDKRAPHPGPYGRGSCHRPAGQGEFCVWPRQKDRGRGGHWSILSWGCS